MGDGSSLSFGLGTYLVPKSTSKESVGIRMDARMQGPDRGPLASLLKKFSRFNDN